MKNKSSLLTAVLFIGLAILIIFGLTACNRPLTPTSEAVSSFAKITSTKTIHALYLVYPPTVSVDKDAAQPSGFLVDVMNEMASRAGWKVEYSPTTFDNLALAISSPNYDVVVGAIFINVPRAKQMDFTTPILYWQGTLGISSAAKASSFSTWADVDKPGVTIAVSAGTAEYDYVKQHVKSATIKPIPNSDLSLVLSEVTAGRVDIAFGDAVTVKKFLQVHSDIAVIMGGKQFNSFSAAFVVKQNDYAWLNFLNNSIQSMQVDGTVSALSQKWGGDSIWLLPKSPWD